jgi:sterol carrier protein 2
LHHSLSLQVGLTKFEKPGAKAGWDYPDMGKDAVVAALADAGVPYSAVEQATVGYVYGDSTCGQRALYSVGLTGIPVYNVNNNCSTGSTALYLARSLVAGGTAECVLALGFEKMQKGSLTSQYADRTNPLDMHVGVMGEHHDLNPKAPFAAQMFGNAGREHMKLYGTTSVRLASRDSNAGTSRMHLCQCMMEANSCIRPLCCCLDRMAASSTSRRSPRRITATR